MQNSNYIGTNEAAKRLGITQAAVRYMCRTGTLTAKKDGFEWIVPDDAIRQCKECGKWFAVNAHNKAYCSEDCKADAKRRRDREYKRRQAAETKEPEELTEIQLSLEDLFPFEVKNSAPSTGMKQKLDEAADALCILAKAIRGIMEELEK